MLVCGEAFCYTVGTDAEKALNRCFAVQKAEEKAGLPDDGGAKGGFMKYVCTVCGYIYDEAAGDPDNGIEAGTKWDALPDDFVCPLCGVGKEDFEVEE